MRRFGKGCGRPFGRTPTAPEIGVTLRPPSGAQGHTENVALELLVHNHPRFYERRQRVGA